MTISRPLEDILHLSLALLSSSLLPLLLLVSLSLAESDCEHRSSPAASFCTGCPPMLGDLPCATTTWYNDMTKGACGCGSEPNPPDYWTKSGYTAAANAMTLGPESPLEAWCPHNCGLCFRLCHTGGSSNGAPSPEHAGECIVVQVENRCGDGYGSPDDGGDWWPYWCGQLMSPWDCLENPDKCKTLGNTNNMGYPAHFDLQDANLQITEGLGWNNPEVTFEEVDCNEGNFPVWEEECYCPKGQSPWGRPTTNEHQTSTSTSTTAEQEPATTTSTTQPDPGDCPGGSLEVCLSLCPTDPPEFYQKCVEQCVAGCSIYIKDNIYQVLSDYEI